VLPGVPPPGPAATVIGDVDGEGGPQNLLGVLLDAYWTSLADDPLAALLLTALLSLVGVLALLLGHIVVDLVGQLLQAVT
jgi:hypothetical protein